MSEFWGYQSMVNDQPFRLRPPIFLCVVDYIHIESLAPNCFDVTAGVIVQNGGYFGIATAFCLARKPRRMSRQIDMKINKLCLVTPRISGICPGWRMQYEIPL